MNTLETILEKARRNPKRVAFAEGDNEKVMQAAFQAMEEGYVFPVL